MQRSDAGEDFRIADLDKEYFEDFKISPTCARFQHAVGDITTTPPLGLGSNYSNSQNNNSYAPAESFKRYVKRDSTFYNSLKDGNH